MQRTDRIEHLRNEHSEALAALAAMQGVRSGTSAFELAREMDPTVKAIYLQWIVRWLVSGTVRFEDGARVRSLLMRFHANKHRLAVEHRDVGRYASPGDISALLDPRTNELVGDVPEEILEECDMVSQADGWSILRLRTSEAAAWWAHATSWCTIHEDTAQDYLDRGPLHVLLHGGSKFQYHLESGQFCDSHDRRVDDLSLFSDDVLSALHDAMKAEYDSDPSDFKRAPSQPMHEVGVALKDRGLHVDHGRRFDGWASANGMITVEAVPDIVDGMRSRDIVVNDGAMRTTLARDTFLVAGAVPKTFLDMLKLGVDIEGDGCSRMSPTMNWFHIHMWWSSSMSYRWLLFDGCARASGRLHMLWLQDDDQPLPTVHALDLEDGLLHIVRDRSDLLGVPASTRLAIRMQALARPYSLPVDHFGADLVGTGLDHWIARLKQAWGQLAGPTRTMRA